MALKISKELRARLLAVGEHPILDSIYVNNNDGTGAEKVWGTKGMYISSEADGWILRGPFGEVE